MSKKEPLRRKTQQRTLEEAIKISNKNVDDMINESIERQKRNELRKQKRIEKGLPPHRTPEEKKKHLEKAFKKYGERIIAENQLEKMRQTTMNNIEKDLIQRNKKILQNKDKEKPIRNMKNYPKNQFVYPNDPDDLSSLQPNYERVIENGHKIEYKKVRGNVIDKYLQLLSEQGKIAKQIKKLLILPTLFYHKLNLIQGKKKTLANPKLTEKQKRETYAELESKKRYKINNLKLNSYNIVFIPVEDRGHWVLIILDFLNNELQVFNSVDEDNSVSIDRINDFLKYQGIEPLDTVYYEVEMQHNHYDCGVFIMEYARSFLNEPAKFEYEDTPFIRERIEEEIENWKLIQDYQYPTQIIAKRHEKRNKTRNKKKKQTRT